jgi:16S rRNA G966 N2-methylase RsmD
MAIQSFKISDVKSNPNNPRLIKDDKFAKLVQSLKDFPEMAKVRPIVVNQDFVVLGGNQRLRAMKEAGWKEVPIQVVDWSEEKQREFIIKDNVGFGEWQWDMLANEWETADLDKWGLDVPGFVEEPEAEEDDFDVPEGGIETDIVLGDLFEIGEHRLLCGDSTDSDAVARLMNGEKADMVFTDPPYGVDVVGSGGTIGGNTKNAKAGNYSKVIGDDKPYDPSHIFLFDCFIFIWGANYFLDKLPSRGQWVVWDKNRPEGTTFSDCELAWTNGDGIAIKKYKCTWDGFHREGESEKRVHPTQKPIKLCSDILNNLSKLNQIIVDLFLGSGSTMVASHQLNRKCYGMELDPKYCQVIVDRMLKLDPNLVIKRNGEVYLKSDENQTYNGVSA